MTHLFVMFCLYIPSIYVHNIHSQLRDRHKLAPCSFHPFACCCVWLLWCSCGCWGKLAGGGVNLMLGWGFLTRGKIMPTQKRLQLAADTLRCGSMCWYTHEPGKQLIPKTDKNTTNVNIVYITLDQADVLLACVYLFQLVCVSVRGLIIWTRWACVGVL